MKIASKPVSKIKQPKKILNKKSPIELLTKTLSKKKITKSNIETTKKQLETLLTYPGTTKKERQVIEKMIERLS